MRNKIYIPILGGTILLISFFVTLFSSNKEKDIETNELLATVISIDDNKFTVCDNNNIIYTFNKKDIRAEVGENIVIEYTGVLDKNKSLQKNDIVGYTISSMTSDENGVPTDYLDDGIFSDYYILAYNYLKGLSLDEKIAQLLLVRYPDNNAKEILEKYKFGGYLFFEKDFRGKTDQEAKNMINESQDVSNTPILTAVDEEGGVVVRVSSNPNLSKEKFKSSSDLYDQGGFDLIRQDTIDKSKLLNSLGLNLNLAPVVDVSTNSSDYMYSRSFKKDTNLTGSYAKTVIDASKNTGVSYTLKHFPGYGNNSDTHTGSSIDNRSYDDIINNDIPPFKEGINAGAEAVLVSHNIVNSIDSNNPASLSPSVHNLLRNELDFTGIIITDDLTMGATSSISNATVKAILAGNDLIITTDYEASINEIKNAINNGTISKDIIDKLAFRIIVWKYYKGLMFVNQK